jgi:hypothetical protein
MSERKTYCVRQNPDVMKNLRILALQVGKKTNDLMDEAIQDLFKKYENKKS